MISQNRTFRVVGPLAVIALLGTILGPGLARSQVGAEVSSQPEPPRANPSTRGDGTAASRPGQSADEQAVRAVDEAFVRAYNQGDSKALAALFTEDAEAVEAEGDHLQGRDQIERRLADTFAASPGVTIALEIGSIRFLSPDVAQEEGRTIVRPTQDTRLAQPYTVLYVKRGGRWLISSVREEADPLVRPHDRLKDLEWMIGDWVDEASDSQVRVNCRWSEDGNFLIRSFTVRQQGKPVMTVSQRIGWDPLARRIRSWEFDSEGGFGEGTWSRDGDRWLVKHTGARPEGVAASSTNILIRERSDLVRWSSTDRVLGEASIPGAQAYVMVRVPPPPRTPPRVQAGPSTSPNPTRSPR
ncbi:MAG TPA: SgcJ/EcaC family oxidoreductase [Isosphaeraceae bacterium]|nr:SgcJ/EcaC family oxidoreductase [Isosphaeraceae bacterium]